MILNDILLVPYIAGNLLSISKFSKDNKVVFEFCDNKFFIKSHVSKATLLESFLDFAGLYCFPLLVMELSRNHSQTMQSSSSLCYTVNSISYSPVSDVNKHNTSLLWNHRLGHAHLQAIQMDLKHCNVSIFNKYSSLLCKSCCLEKSNKIHATLS